MEDRQEAPHAVAEVAATTAAVPSAGLPPTDEAEARRRADRGLPMPVAPTPARRWHEDTDSAGEPTEIREYERKPARFYAPPGQCVYCDRRREAARRSMAAVRERGTEA